MPTKETKMETTILKTADLFAPGGLRKAFYALVLGGVFSLFDLELFAALCVAFAIATLYWYYQPKKFVPNLENSAVASPVDGKVIAIEEIESQKYGYRLCIEGSYFDKGALYAPVRADSCVFSLRRGSRLKENASLFEILNERLEVTFFVNDLEVKCEHTLKRSIFDLHVDSFKKMYEVGAYYGFALNAQTYIYLPKSFRLNVHVGSKLHARQNILGYFSS